MAYHGLTSRQVALLVALAAAGIALRFAALDRSYWFDELATLNSVDASSLRVVLQNTSQDNQPPLYNSAVYAWIGAFGLSEVAVRSLSVLFGLLALFTPWLARAALSRTQKLLICTILCLMPLPIRYAQEARNYSLMFLLSATCLFCYYEILCAKARQATQQLLPLQGLLYASLILLAFSHIFGLILAASFLAVMFWQQPRLLGRVLLVVFGAALSAAIVIPLIHGGSGRLAGGNFWITFSAESLSTQLLWVFTPVGLVLLSYALVLWRRDAGRSRLDPALLQVLMPFVLMLVGSIIISFNTPIITDRNLIGLIAAFALLTGWLLQRVFARHAATVTCALLCLLLLQATALTFSPYLFIQQDFRAIALHSIATDSRVCYVLPDAHLVPDRIFSIYIRRIYRRPDLMPQMLKPSQVPAQLGPSDCRLWAASLSKRGVSLLRTLPQLNRCTDVPLREPGARIASELLDCRS